MGEHEKARYVLLDSARAGAITMVLFGHIGERIGSPLGHIFSLGGFYSVGLGGVAVTILLFLSGIVLELRYGMRNFRYFDFLLKRCLRIYPVYYMALFVGLSAFVWDVHQQTGVTHSLFSSFGLSDLILSVTGFYAFAGRWGGPFMPASWFVGLIIVLYIFYPILSRAIANNPHVTIVVLLLISALSRLLLGRYFCLLLPTRPIDWFPLCRVFEFSLGIYAARILPASIWSVLSSTKHLSGVIAFVSRISLPLFLIDYPIWLATHIFLASLHPLLAILVFILVSVLLGWLMAAVDQHIPRRRILERVRYRWNAFTARPAGPANPF